MEAQGYIYIYISFIQRWLHSTKEIFFSFVCMSVYIHRQPFNAPFYPQPNSNISWFKVSLYSCWSLKHSISLCSEPLLLELFALRSNCDPGGKKLKAFMLRKKKGTYEIFIGLLLQQGRRRYQYDYAT